MILEYISGGSLADLMKRHPHGLPLVRTPYCVLINCPTSGKGAPLHAHCVTRLGEQVWLERGTTVCLWARVDLDVEKPM